MQCVRGSRLDNVLVEQFSVVDGHNDLAWAMRGSGYDFDVVDIARSQPHLHTDLPRIRAGGLRGQFWSVFVPGSLLGADALTATVEQVEQVDCMIERYPDDLALVTTADGLATACRGTGPVASLMGAEGGHSIDGSLGALRMLYRMGVRYLTLTHNENNVLADSVTDTPRHGGLSDFGRSVVREMNRIGMLVDLSHVHAETMRQSLDTSTAPVIFSHSSTRAVCDHPRNVPDDVLTRLATNGGTCMITFVPRFVSQRVHDWWTAHPDGDRADAPTATLDDVVAHCEHAREVAGIDHLGLGGDFDGVSTLPTGIADVSAYPAVLAALGERGWSDDDLTKISHANVIRTLRAAEGIAAGLRDQRPDLTRLDPVGAA